MSPDGVNDVNAETRRKAERLRSLLAGYGSALVAYSGGVDSAYLLHAAVAVLGDRAVGLTAISPSIPRDEVEAARSLAARMGARQITVESRELEDPRYVANPANRCFFCKDELFALASARARELGLSVVLDGTNFDDLSDIRPGREAARAWGVLSPLAEVGLRKAEIRALGREAGLPVWDKPAAPCLASRIPHGTPVTIERLDQVGRAEAALRALGLAVLRVRHHGEVARLEVEAAAMPRILDPQVREQIVAAVRAAGFRYVALDLAGFRSGSLNPPPP